MKFLLFLLLSVISHAQTQKWTQGAVAPAFLFDTSSMSHLRADTGGNVAFGVTYQKSGEGVVGVQVQWMSAAGKILHSEILPGDSLQDPRILSVSPSVLLVQFYSTAGNPILRKYTRRGATVTAKDTPLGQDEYVVNDPDEVQMNDKLGFFVVFSAQNGNFLGIRRYTLR